MSTAILANAISTLEQRIGAQEARILDLEKEVRRYQIDRAINGSMSFSHHTANVALFSKYLHQHAKAPCLAPPSTPYQEEQHPGTQSSSPLLLTTAPDPIPVTDNPSSCHSSLEVQTPLDPTPSEAMAPSKSNAPYHFDDLNAFESRLAALPKNNSISVIAPPPRELPATLLEGIGSAEQTTHHEKGCDSGVEICVEEDVSVSCTASVIFLFASLTSPYRSSVCLESINQIQANL